MSSYEIMSNSHSYYQVGSKKDTGETFYGYVRNLKVFKRLLYYHEIQQEAGTYVVCVYIMRAKFLTSYHPKIFPNG